MTHGSTINASVAVEKGGSSVWGVSLNVVGTLLLLYGFVVGLSLMLEQISLPLTLFLGILLFLGFMLFVTVSTSRGDETGVKSALSNIKSWGIISGIVIALSPLFIIMFGGGEGAVIPESAWALLMGAMTMIGAAFAAALCIMAAVKAGSEMLIQKPELSIWSLLFVALGEGLAIYGLIVAILIVSA